MKNLIYYPTFEPTDINWLKYALIYIDQFSPIIPSNQKEALSDVFKKINDNTDLIKIHIPNYSQGDNAATKALKEIEFIEIHPEQYRDKFNSVNILRAWMEPANWQFELCEEKYNETFKIECIKKGFGKASKGGLLTSKELAQLYMTFLVEEIAYEKEGNPITDLQELDSLSTYLRSKNLKNDKILNAAKTVTSISLPANIEQIGIDKLIEFRMESGITELRKSFNSTLNKFYETLEEDFNPNDFLLHIEKTNLELVKEIGLFFGGTISASLGGLILAENPQNLEIAKQILEGTIFGITGVVSIKKAWDSGSDKKHVRKFISKISQLK